MNGKPRYALIVAGGRGLRMGAEMPKQFLPLTGLPVLMHTMRRLAPHVDEIVLVLPVEHHSFWQELCTRYGFMSPHRVAAGGDTRFASVHSGLELVPDGALVAIHDGVRPLVSDETIEACFHAAEAAGAAAPYRPLTESLRYYTPEANHAVDRSQYVTVQTPQTFRSEWIREAYAMPYEERFTDDCSVYESSFGRPVTLVEGNAENIKLTTPQDLALAELLMR